VWKWTHENIEITDVTANGMRISGDGTCLEIAGNAWNDLSCSEHIKKVYVYYNADCCIHLQILTERFKLCIF